MMPLFQETPTPELAAAGLRLSIAPPERTPLWAAHWLTEDLDGTDLRLLAGMSGQDLDEVRAVLPWALAEAGAPEPEPELGAAARVVFTALARACADGLATEEQLLHAVDWICRATGYDEAVLAAPLAQVLAVEGEWTGLGGRDRATLRAEIRAAVTAQLDPPG
ncbi:hypothetical protein [Crossiella cryophila]|uniref:Uncharacterized protein n=1 Tax=Crossiella cryophila TaxID=43355 RepID=A0A7W7CDY8_9PSEU|nr:hypothetical protein [Crossiella cryophila]MBB4679364.1 hypothetical protein [Crossiella cryophila]